MPINDSAGVGVYLIDKSQRSSATAIGFRSAGAIEADRGLCNTPTLISSESDYVKTFGTPNMERHGLAAMEAYLLAQRRVPQVLTRAKNPELDANSKVFGSMRFYIKDGKLEVKTDEPANAIGAPKEDSESILYFKGEGDYCSHDENTNQANVVVRICQPATQSAYATAGHSFCVQVYDFDGTNHTDMDTEAELSFNPDVSSIIGNDGLFKLDGFGVYPLGSATPGEDDKLPVKVSAFVNGSSNVVKDLNYIDSESWDNGMFGVFHDAICGAKESDSGKPIIESGWLSYIPNDGSFGSDGGDLSDYAGSYVLISEDPDTGRSAVNAFGLSITLTAEVTLPIYQLDGGKPLAPGFYSFSCGSVTISKRDETYSSVWGTEYSAKFSVSTSLYLKNRNSYMFMGKQNSDWASYYAAYLKESYVVSMSYEDFDANYITMQTDAVLAGSNYLVAKSSDTFGNYTIDYAVDPITNDLHYFDGAIEANKIDTPSKSYAYSQALVSLLGDNLTRWRCLATPNLGDIMNPADYVSAINAATESTLGLSNIGKAASVDVFSNLNGRHGNRFIADYSQYAYRTLAGKRTAVTVACLVADLLNNHYNAGIEARPPFGYTYGQISCLSLSQEFSGPERNMLALQLKINPVIEDGGYYVWEERTSQLTDTSLSDIHCVVSFIWMKFAIYDAMKSFVAEYNDQSTVNRGLSVLNQLNQTFISKNYIEEGKPNADRNVLGDEVLRFDYPIRFKGVARFVDVYITAYSQTQTLSVSLAMEA